MESRIAKEAEKAATQRLTPEERVNAFLTHCRLVAELYSAGKALREPDSDLRP
jgi:hypothetical protein